MKARLLVCTTCDRYAATVVQPTMGERMLEAVRAEAERRGLASRVNTVACVMSCPRPCGVAVHEGRGGGVHRFARLQPSDAPELLDFLEAHADVDAPSVPASLAPRRAGYTPPRT
jgi:predicted metal-binding protein